MSLRDDLNILDRLFALQDVGYREFTAKLLPNVEAERVIGVRSPEIKALAKELAGTPEAASFLEALPHVYLEENHLHAQLLNRARDYDACVAGLNRFLPFVDNWATCDSLRPNCFAKRHERLITDVRRWLSGGAEYTVRFGLGMLMTHYLDRDFRPEYLDWAAAVDTEKFYVHMMVAWYFATALAKQYDAALPFLEQRRLDPRTHRRAIQKAVESYRITDAQKAYLRTLK